MALSTYTPFCDALVLLMNPLMEIVIHDLQSETICYINGELSKRKIGDPSLLDLDNLETNIDKIVYPKLSYDGHLIKSISVPLENKWLLCMNCDISIFDQMHKIGQQFLNTDTQNTPASLFKNDWQERLHIAVHSFLKDQSWDFNNLSGNQKKQLVKHLFEINAFNEKNATDYVATTLNMGRATIFKYLKEWRIK